MKNLDKEKIVNIIIIIALIFLTLIRIGLWNKTPILIYSDELNDDKLLYDYANTISKGEWLGEYNQLTLVKGISFSVFEVICNKLSIPYPIALAILNVISAILICCALRTKIDKKYLALIYLVILYSPVGFTSLISQRNYRNSIIAYTVLLAFAGYIGMFLRKDKSIKNILCWSLISTIALIFFWYVKEDSIWILPFVLTISILTFIYWLIHYRKHIILKTLILIIPIICLIFTNTLISSINNKYYGISVVSDKSGAEFGKMISNLYRIEDTNRTAESGIWITNNMLQKAFSVSQTFAELKPNMDVFGGWTDGNWEVAGDLMIWKIRYVMSVQNYFENAVKAEEFCRKVNEELEIAFANNLLTKDNKLHIASQARGLSLTDLINYLPASFDWLNDFSKYDNCGITESMSIGKTEEIQEIREFLNISKIPTEEEFKEVQKTSNNIVTIYQKIAPVTNVLAILGYIIFTIYMISETIKKEYSSWNIWFVSTGVTLSAILLSFELNLFLDFFSIEKLARFRTFYSAGVFPLIEISKYVNIYLLFTCILKIIKYQKDKIENEKAK